MDLFAHITRPTLIIDPQRVQTNVEYMAAKARQAGVSFRPHFKTHQSALVGEWFRQVGVTAITVSSVEMAEFFAGQGWENISIAFSLNLRELDSVARLAAKIHLEVLVESKESAAALAQIAPAQMEVWIKIDTGNGRTGIDFRDIDLVRAVAQEITRHANTHLRGLLTHAGHTYKAVNPRQIIEIYTQSWQRLADVQAALANEFGRLELSVGDTPGCTHSPSLGKVDEIRPGNFVFYDGQMLRLGVCRPEQIAAIVVCPVVALHPERNEAVIYGGAVHLSKDTLVEDGRALFGYVAPLTETGWGAPIPNAGVVRLSQEHGILSLPAGELARLHVGDLVGIIPAHICLAVAALGGYQTLSGEKVKILEVPG